MGESTKQRGGEGETGRGRGVDGAQQLVVSRPVVLYANICVQ